MNRKRTRRRLAQFSIAPVALAIAVAGCGGSGGSSSSSTTAAAAGPAGGTIQISAKQRSCLKQHGLNGPPGGGAPGTPGQAPPFGGAQGSRPNIAKLRSAFQACGVQPPQGGPPHANSAAFKSSVTKFASCMAQNGYKLPKPNLSGNGPVFNSSQVNRSDPKFIAASKTCSQLLARGGPGGAPAGA